MNSNYKPGNFYTMQW